MVDKAQLPPWESPQSVTTLVGAKTVSKAYAYKHGSTTVVELAFSDSTTNFIKFSNQGLEIGGTLELGTGTKVGW